MDISIIIVNSNSQFFVEKCLKSIEKIVTKNFQLKKIEIIIVNNETKTLKLKKTFKLKIEKIENRKNLGFGKACNLGAKKARGNYLFFLNPDTELLNCDFSLIIKKFRNDDSIGIIGTKIIEKKRRAVQPWTCGKKTSFWRIIFKNSINKPWNKKIPIVVDWVSGTSFFIKKNIFQQLKGFDENFFMYFEDQDLCLRLKKLGKKCLFFPYFSVLHYNGKSWTNNNFKKQIYYKSQNYFFKKHFNYWHYLVLIFAKKILNK